MGNSCAPEGGSYDNGAQFALSETALLDIKTPVSSSLVGGGNKSRNSKYARRRLDSQQSAQGKGTFAVYHILPHCVPGQHLSGSSRSSRASGRSQRSVRRPSLPSSDLAMQMTRRTQEQRHSGLGRNTPEPTEIDSISKIRLRCCHPINAEKFNMCEWALGVGMISSELLSQNSTQFQTLFQQRGPHLFTDYPHLGCMVSYKGFFNEVGIPTFAKVAWKRGDILELSYEMNVKQESHKFSPVASDDDDDTTGKPNILKLAIDTSKVEMNSEYFSPKGKGRKKVPSQAPDQPALLKDTEEDTKQTQSAAPTSEETTSPTTDAQVTATPTSGFTQQLQAEANRRPSQLSQALAQSAKLTHRNLGGPTSLRDIIDEDEDENSDSEPEEGQTPIKVRGPFSPDKDKETTTSVDSKTFYTLSITRIPANNRMGIKQSLVKLPVAIKGPAHFAVFNSGRAKCRWEIVA